MTATNATEYVSESIIGLYQNYRDFTLFGALSGNFDFESDQAAYDAVVRGDVDGMKSLIEQRKAQTGQHDFKTTETDKRRHEARHLIDQEWKRTH